MNKKANFMVMSNFMIALLIVFVILIMCLMISSLLANIECNKLDECESYKCLSVNGGTLFEQNNAALKYQNCLLEEREERPQKN